ncbi:serine phosphatase RsbU (regulator of sigma subunit)/anti-sigma regulatory factor (Ser/Thr protein kinase) [Streptomyces sp. LBL]|uniref:SpoIIE family protein phosphatase n=1 Tax=Streptomyces sp. LBL TaxID=2940562 RepID=UPI002476DBEC|nr:SpoIIE family protein phosphatase [Streptomyces sp. LBL]MDH6627700.1 serine phosphatase RsbU (regulator of sigma subunit)/anti-sigma regulatory factor (Ser/Thr protein kinase) [Streptomyces sp. LBL]
MGAIPTQRETDSRASGAPVPGGAHPRAEEHPHADAPPRTETHPATTAPPRADTHPATAPPYTDVLPATATPARADTRPATAAPPRPDEHPAPTPPYADEHPATASPRADAHPATDEPPRAKAHPPIDELPELPETPRAETHATLPGSPLAPGSARALLRAALADWAERGLPGTEHLSDRLADDAVAVVSELVTNAVVYAGTDVAVECRLEAETGAVVVEVLDHHPSRAPRDVAVEPPYETPEHGRGLRLVAALAESWGITYRTGAKTVWARLPAHGVPTAGEHAASAGERGLHVAGILAPEPQRTEEERDWLGRGALSFLAEASDLLAGQLDENLVAALAGQLIVPRLADWCAVWLEDEVTGRAGWTADGPAGTGPQLARVWHAGEHRIEDLRRALEKESPRPPDPARSGPAAFPWPRQALGPDGSALAYRLTAGGRPLGTLVIGRAGLQSYPDEITGLVEDLSRRVALAIGAARQYARQATISAVLQRGLLPGAVAEIPGMRSALVYEPCDKGGPSGDFYDIFPAGDGRWCFAVGDVQGKGPEAAVVIGLARPWLRLLAREGYRVADVLDRLNQLLLDDATEAADAAARALAAAGGRPTGPGDGPQTRFLSLLYGELAPFDGGVRCTLASAGHPLPLLLGAGGEVRTAAHPQTLIGVIEDATYTSETFELRSGDSLLCVTDGVTERRSGSRQFDDEDGLAEALAGCVGLDAELIAARIKRLVHEFGVRPPADDLALLVLQAE